jgi:hypothetical protein
MSESIPIAANKGRKVDASGLGEYSTSRRGRKVSITNSDGSRAMPFAQLKVV